MGPERRWLNVAECVRRYCEEVAVVTDGEAGAGCPPVVAVGSVCVTVMRSAHGTVEVASVYVIAG